MTLISTSFVSCGVAQLSGLYNASPIDTFMQVTHYGSNETSLYRKSKVSDVDQSKLNFAFAVFSDMERGNGRNFAKFLREQGFKVDESESKVNPTTTNRIVVYTWYLPPTSAIDEVWSRILVDGKINFDRSSKINRGLPRPSYQILPKAST